MEDASRPGSEQYQDSTRWMLVVLVAVSVLAAGVLAVSNVPDLIGDPWQVVGAASAALTVGALLVAVFVVLRALDPIADDEPGEGPVAAPSVAVVDPSPPIPGGPTDGAPSDGNADAVDEASGADEAGVEGGENDSSGGGAETDGADVDVSGAEGAAAVVMLGPPIDGSSRRAQRQAATRYRRARSVVGVAVVAAFVGMTGMTVAAVADGNNVEDRARRALDEQLTLEEDGPITEPQAVAVQFTTPGLRRVAEAMGCTGQQIGTRPVQGWAVSGTFRNPVVVLFGPTAACDNVQVALAPRDGFVYPAVGGPTTATTRPAPTTTTVAGGGGGTPAGGGAPAGGGPAAPGAPVTPTPAAP